jgi:hypothetical protein
MVNAAAAMVVEIGSISPTVRRRECVAGLIRWCHRLNGLRRDQ